MGEGEYVWDLESRGWGWRWGDSAEAKGKEGRDLACRSQRIRRTDASRMYISSFLRCFHVNGVYMRRLCTKSVGSTVYQTPALKDLLSSPPVVYGSMIKCMLMNPSQSVARPARPISKYEAKGWWTLVRRKMGIISTCLPRVRLRVDAGVGVSCAFVEEAKVFGVLAA